MPPPPNTTFGTAIAITTLPFVTTQDAMDHDDGLVYDLWYTYTPSDSYVYGMFAYGNFSDYFVECEVYTLVAGVPTSYLGLGSNNRDDRPVYFPVTSGETYYIKLVDDSDPGIPAAICNISFKRSPEEEIQVGDIFVPDERDGFPAAIIDPATGDIRAMATEFNDTPSVAGDVLLNGTFLLDDRTNQNFELYDADFNLLTVVAFPWTGSYPIVRTCRPGNCFYVANRVSETPGPTDFPIVKRIDANGVIGLSWTLPQTGLVSLAVNNAETIMYNAGQGLNSAALNAPIKRWDLVNSVMVSDFAAAVAGYSVRSLMVLADDTILALYGESVGTPDAFIRHYDTSGTILHTYTLGETVVTGYASNYLFQALDDPASFWVRHHPRVGGEFNITEHTHIEVSSGTELAAVLTTEFTAGVATRFTEEAALPQFGNAPSCPVFLLQATITPPPPPTTSVCPPQNWLLPAASGCVAIGELPDNA